MIFITGFFSAIICSSVSHFVETSYLTFIAIQLTGSHVMRHLCERNLETDYKQFPICVYLCVYKCVFMYMYGHMYVHISVYICVCVYVYICIYVCVYVCIYLYIYVYYCLTFKLLLRSSFEGIFWVRFSLDGIYQF